MTIYTDTLTDLPSSTPTYDYHGPEDVHEKLRQLLLSHSPSQFAVFENVTDRDADILFLSKFFLGGTAEHDATRHLLVVKMQHMPSDIIARGMQWMLEEKLADMNLASDLTVRGTDRMKALVRSKQPDFYLDACADEPEERPGQTIYPRRPAIAFECGLAKSAAKLERYMDFWLNEVENKFAMGITVTVDETFNDVTIASWRRVEAQNGRPSIERSSKLWILQAPGDVPLFPQLPGWNDDCFTIPFECMMLRQPENPVEQDFALDREGLGMIAKMVWSKMHEGSLRTENYVS